MAYKVKVFNKAKNAERMEDKINEFLDETNVVQISSTVSSIVDGRMWVIMFYKDNT